MEANWLSIGATAFVGLVLVVFGVAYNGLVARLERKSESEPYTAYLVAFGCLMVVMGLVLMAAAWYGWPVGLGVGALALVGFGCAGVPMIVGSMWRHMRERGLAREVLADVAKEATALREHESDN